VAASTVNDSGIKIFGSLQVKVYRITDWAQLSG